MEVWILADDREIDRLPTCMIFYNKDDAEEMRESFGDDKKHWDLFVEEIIKCQT